MTLHAVDAAEVARELGSDTERGLRGEEAAARLSRYGPNELQSGDEVHPGGSCSAS